MMLQLLITLSVYIPYTYALSLPKLPNRFTAIVEANIIQKNKTYIMEEWYDFPANKAKRAFYREDLIITTYEDFSDGKDQLWQYQTTHNDTSNAISCTLDAYSQNNRGFGRNDQTQSGHIASSAQWFQFGSNFTETYLGNNFAVRGITAEAWTRNVTYSVSYGFPTTTVNISFELTYYFSVQNWSWFASSEHRIPLRVDLEGERVTDNGTSITSYNFHHFYDYVQFFADDLTLTQELKFDIPDFYEQCNVTKYCNVYDTSDICKLTKGPPLPTVPTAFRATWEWTEKDTLWSPTGGTGIEEVYYDYNNNREHVVERWFEAGFYENAYHQLNVLDDDGEGQRWLWVGDGVEWTPMTSDDAIKNCVMTGFTSNFSGYDFVIPVSNGHIASPSRFMIYDDNDASGVSQEIWMGYTTIRGIPAEKWKANYNIVVNGGEKSYWVFYTLPSNQRIVMNGSVYWYFSYNWTFMYSPDEQVIPLATEIIGTYTLYNYSDTLSDYVEVLTSEINTVAHITNWLTGTPDESYFKPPTYWRRYCTIDDEYCSKEEHEDHVDEDVCDKGLDLPTLPEHKYYVVLEGNDIDNETSHVIKLWWDYDNNEVRSEYYNDDNVIVTFDDFDEDRTWTWMHKTSDLDTIMYCKVESYKEKAKTRAWTEANVNVGHVKSAAELWQFGEEYNVTYLGNGFNIRGINARAWHRAHNSTILWNGTTETNVNIESIFYFADSSWNYYKGIETSNIPLSIIYKGTWENAQNSNYSGEFNTEYHMSSFFSGPSAFDRSEMEFVFEDWYSKCDVTSYCNFYPNNKLCSDSKGPEMPNLPQQWYGMLEATQQDGFGEYTGTSIWEEWYDYNANRAHLVWHNGPNWKGDTMHQLDRLDVNQKWIWIGDGDDDDHDGDEIKQCLLTPNIQNFTGLDVFITETNGHIAKPSTYFRWNDTKYAANPIWNGYTTFRGIPAQKWKAYWSEYDEVPGSVFQKTYATKVDAYATYYWSNASWNMAISDWDSSIPLGVTVEGTYTLYNYSESTKKYDILWTTNSFKSNWHYIIFNTELDDDGNYFEIPSHWKECNVSTYCAKYPNREPCTGKVTRDTISDKDKGENDGLSAGYIVLMFVLFFIGLLIGVIIDRYLTRKRKDQGFQGFQTNANEKQVDATL